LSRLSWHLLRFTDLLLQALQLVLQRIDLTLQSLGLSVLGCRTCWHEHRAGERPQHQYVESVLDSHRKSPVVRTVEPNEAAKDVRQL
jgi:hypothetical protein